MMARLRMFLGLGTRRDAGKGARGVMAVSRVAAMRLVAVFVSVRVSRGNPEPATPSSKALTDGDEARAAWLFLPIMGFPHPVPTLVPGMNRFHLACLLPVRRWLFRPWRSCSREDRAQEEASPRGGEPYFVEGAGGTVHLDELMATGGNSVRAWTANGLR